MDLPCGHDLPRRIYESILRLYLHKVHQYWYLEATMHLQAIATMALIRDPEPAQTC